MGYRVSLYTPVTGDEIHSKHITSNVAPMWRQAGVEVREWERKNAADVLPALRVAIADMIAHPHRYEVLNPATGYGSYTSCLRFLTEWRDVFLDHPEGVIVVDY